MLLDTPLADSQSEKEVRKSKVKNNLLTPGPKKKIPASRFSVDYWRDRLFHPAYNSGTERQEVQEWYVQVQHAQRREKVGLGTNNREEAARRAAKFYQRLRATDWETSLTEINPRREAIRATNSLTLGDYLAQVQPLLRVRPRTTEIYSYALRKIAREATGAVDKSKSRFHPKSHDWRRVSDEIPLAKLTPTLINEWKDKIIAKAGPARKDRERAGRNINSFLRSARALFSRNIVARLKEKGVKLPKPLPFEDVKLEAQGSTKYESSIDPKELLKNARTELLPNAPDSWKVILLALGAGLRRAEIDALRWDQIDFKKSVLRVCSHGKFETKTQDSEGSVDVDQGLLEELKKFHIAEKTDFVVAPELQSGATAAVQYYRCEPVFMKVTAWLRQQGVKGDKPLHALRKEFGSIICASADIHTASRQLRHSNLSTTAAFYLDNRRRVSVPIGALLADDPTLLGPKPSDDQAQAPGNDPETVPVSPS